MTKLLLNSGTTPLYSETGAPVPPGTIVTDDELATDHEALFAEGVLVYVRPSEVPAGATNVSPGAAEHLAEWAKERKAAARSGNAERAVRDDAAVTPTPEQTEGGSS